MRIEEEDKRIDSCKGLFVSDMRIEEVCTHTVSAVYTVSLFQLMMRFLSSTFFACKMANSASRPLEGANKMGTSFGIVCTKCTSRGSCVMEV